MGLFGGSSKSKNTTTNTSKTTNFNNMGEATGSGGAGVAGNLNLADSEFSIQGDVISSDHGAMSVAGDVAGKALQGNVDLSDRAFDTVDSTQEITQKLFHTASGAVTDATRGTLQQMAGQTDRALAFATQATKSEGAALTENLTKWGIGGAAVLAVAIAFMNRS